MGNLYTFSKNAWHVKLFKWIYNTDPTQTFNTMCPYFWSLVATFILLPIILVVKLFGSGGTKVLSKLESYKRDRRDKKGKAFVEKCSKEDITEEEAFNIVKNCGWSDYRWYLDYELETEIKHKYWNYVEVLASRINKKKENAQIRKQKIAEVKESKWFTYTAYLVSIISISALLFGLYSLVSLIEFSTIDWDAVKYVACVFGGIAGVILGAYGVIMYIIIPIADYLSCLDNCILCKLNIWKYIFAPFKFLWNGILIIVDMIYMTYKKACPRITWKDNVK